MKLEDFTVGWICAIPIELTAFESVLDEVYEPESLNPDIYKLGDDRTNYVFGRIHRHNVVAACLPMGNIGTLEACSVANRMKAAFKKLDFGLVVGVGGGALGLVNQSGALTVHNKKDVRLGDVVVSRNLDGHSAVCQYDFGKSTQDGKFEMTGPGKGPPDALLNAMATMNAKNAGTLGKFISDTVCEIGETKSIFQYPAAGSGTDRLYRPDYHHPENKTTCDNCDSSKIIKREDRPNSYPVIHYGPIASGNRVMKNGIERDIIGEKTGAFCFEMEAAGVMCVLDSLVIRGM